MIKNLLLLPLKSQQAFLHFEKTHQEIGFVNRETHFFSGNAYQLCKPLATSPFHASQL